MIPRDFDRLRAAVARADALAHAAVAAFDDTMTAGRVDSQALERLGELVGAASEAAAAALNAVDALNSELADGSKPTGEPEAWG